MQPGNTLSGLEDQNIPRAHGCAADSVSGPGLIAGHPGHIDPVLTIGPPDQSGTVKTRRSCPAAAVPRSHLGTRRLGHPRSGRAILNNHRPYRSDIPGTTGRERTQNQTQKKNPQTGSSHSPPPGHVLNSILHEAMPYQSSAELPSLGFLSAPHGKPFPHHLFTRNGFLFLSRCGRILACCVVSVFSPVQKELDFRPGLSENGRPCRNATASSVTADSPPHSAAVRVPARRSSFFRWISRQDNAAGVTPEIRPACPRFPGCTALSFSTISRVNPATEA